jgi:hypothetical protein
MLVFSIKPALAPLLTSVDLSTAHYQQFGFWECFRGNRPLCRELSICFRYTTIARHLTLLLKLNWCKYSFFFFKPINAFLDLASSSMIWLFLYTSDSQPPIGTTLILVKRLSLDNTISAPIFIECYMSEQRKEYTLNGCCSFGAQWIKALGS